MAWITWPVRRRRPTSFVDDKVSGAELVVVQVLDGDEVVGADAKFDSAVLPHDVGRGLGGHHFHGHSAHTHARARTHVTI